jgi:hypothetical protein
MAVAMAVAMAMETLAMASFGPRLVNIGSQCSDWAGLGQYGVFSHTSPKQRQYRPDLSSDLNWPRAAAATSDQRPATSDQRPATATGRGPSYQRKAAGRYMIDLHSDLHSVLYSVLQSVSRRFRVGFASVSRRFPSRLIPFPFQLHILFYIPFYIPAI